MLLTALPMMVCLFWTVFLLTNYIETHNAVMGRLTGFMLVATLLYGGHYVFFNHFDAILTTSDTIYVYANLAVFPLYLRYIEELTLKEHHINLWRLLLVLPPFVMASAVLLTYLRMDEAQTKQFIDTYLYQNSMDGLTGTAWLQAVIHTVAKVLFAIQILPIFIIGNRRIHQYEKECKSASLVADLQPVRFMLLLFAVVSAFSFAANLVGRHNFTGSPALLAIPSVIFSVFLYYLGYLGYRVEAKPIAKDLHEREEPQPVKVVTPHYNFPEGVKDDPAFEALPLRQRIDHLMNVEQMYLQPNLKISNLAQRLGSNRNYIYEAINKDMGISFTEFVNRLRVAHSQQLMKQNPSMLLGEVAVKSGFSSTVSFYRAFKKYIGCAPKEWQSDSQE